MLHVLDGTARLAVWQPHGHARCPLCAPSRGRLSGERAALAGTPSSSTRYTHKPRTHAPANTVGLRAGAEIQRMPVARILAHCASCLRLQAFSYLGYGERSRARLNLKARNPQIPGALGVELPWHAGMDWVFQPGDLLVHSAHLKRLRNFWPDDAPVNGSVAADAMTTCAVRPNVTYHRRHGRLVFELRGQKQRGTMR